MASEKWGEEPSGQLGVVQEELTRNNADIAQLEQLWAQDPHNPLFQRMYERLAKKEQLLLEERKIWAGDFPDFCLESPASRRRFFKFMEHMVKNWACLLPGLRLLQLVNMNTFGPQDLYK